LDPVFSSEAAGYLVFRFDIAYVTFSLIVRKRYRKVVYEQAHRVLEFPQPFNQSAFLAFFLPASFPVRRVRRIRAFLISNTEDAIVLLVKLAQKVAAKLFFSSLYCVFLGLFHLQQQVPEGCRPGMLRDELDNPVQLSL